jgi:hypothetical protein
MPIHDATGSQSTNCSPTPLFKEPIRISIFVPRHWYQKVSWHPVDGFQQSELHSCLLTCQRYMTILIKVSNSSGGICLWSLNSVRKRFSGVRHPNAIPSCCPGCGQWSIYLSIYLSSIYILYLYIISRSVWGVICSISSEAAERLGSVDSYTGVFWCPEDVPLGLESQFLAQSIYFGGFLPRRTVLPPGSRQVS